MYQNPLHEWFPNGTIVSHSLHQAGYIYLPLSEQTWLEIAQADLTEREQALLTFLLEEKTGVSQHPWLSFLQGQDSKKPQLPTKLQFVHIRIWKKETVKADVSGWLEMMADLLPHQAAVFWLSDQELTFVLDQEQSIEVEELLSETLPTMEYDFGLRLTVFLGQIWSQLLDADLRRVFAEERRLVTAWQNHHQQARVLSFSHLFLWGQGRVAELTSIPRLLGQLMSRQEQLADVIVALWQEGAVVTKAAQRLYLHRNTLQYRLEKWQELTGLQLRNLTDLAFCYTILMNERG